MIEHLFIWNYNLADSKVTYFDGGQVGVKQEVVELDVSVQNEVAMYLLECPHYLLYYLLRFSLSQSLAVLYEV